MPSRYRHDRHRLWAEIVARVDAGETLEAICAAPGIPAPGTVWNWARADALFGAELAAARGRAKWRRLWGFDEAKAAAFLVRVRAGHPIRSVWNQPGMPTRGQVLRWRTSQPAFAEAVFPVLTRRNAQIGEHGRARRRGFDRAVADRIVGRYARRLDLSLEDLLKADPGLPCWETMMGWRREQPEFDRVLKAVMASRRRRGPLVPQARIDAVKRHIIRGGTFLSYSRLPGGASCGALRRWMRDPAFAKAVERACDLREEFLQDQVSDYALGVPPGTIREMNRAIAPLTRRIGWLKKRPRKPLWPVAQKDRLSPAKTGEREATMSGADLP